MAKIVQTTGGVCELCGHHQQNHYHNDGCDLCDCKSRGKRVII